MRHDRNYRRVLKSHNEYLSRYKVFASVCFTGFFLKKLFDDRKGKNADKRLNSKLKSINNKEDDIIKSHEKWYFTLLDRRLWILMVDFFNISVNGLDTFR